MFLKQKLFLLLWPTFFLYQIAKTFIFAIWCQNRPFIIKLKAPSPYDINNPFFLSYSLCNLLVSIFWNIFYNRLFTRIQCFCEIALLTYLPWSIWKRMLISAAQSLLTLKQFIIRIFRLHMDFLIDCPWVRVQKVTIWTRLHNF